MSQWRVQRRVLFFKCRSRRDERRIRIEVDKRPSHDMYDRQCFQGMAFSPMTFTTSPAQSHMCGTGRTPMSTPSRVRSDLGSARKLRLVNEQDELVS
jgi:hypothetical protein